MSNWRAASRGHAVVIDTEAVDPRDPEALRRWVRQESGLEPLPWA